MEIGGVQQITNLEVVGGGEGHDVFFNEFIKTNNIKTICEVGTYMGKKYMCFCKNASRRW
jgi:hypothetical protein